MSATDVYVAACHEISIESLDRHRNLGATLFERLAEDLESVHFRPHPLTQAHALSWQWRKDVYMLALVRSEFGERWAAAYGMLRGWDDGYEIPSLGIAVHPLARSIGLGRAMMHYLHCVARARNAPAVRLRVDPSNTIAIKLYTDLGYAWSDALEDGQRVGILRFRA